MSDITLWDILAANNNSVAPDGWPEGMLPSDVNNAAREIMAAVRRAFEDLEWFNFNDAITFSAGNQFTVAGDLTARYHVGRRLRAVGGGTGTIFGTVSVSAFSSVTTVTVVWDSGALVNESLAMSLAANSADFKSISYLAIHDLIAANIPYDNAASGLTASDVKAALDEIWADLVANGNFASHSEEWANKAEDSLVSAAAGGDQVDDYSALHQANKADASRILSQTAQTASETAQTASETAQGLSETAQTASELAETNSAASEFNINIKWLSPAASDPTLDDNGDPVVAGAAYTNTGSGNIRYYNGSVWADITIYVHPNHTGDVTSAGDGAQTITANAVTLAKMAQMATDSLLGRDTAGSGNVEVLTPAQVRTILGLVIGTNVLTQTGNATQGEMEAGAETANRIMNPEGVKQAIDALAAGGAWELLETWTPTAVNSKDFTWDESVYSDIKIVFQDLRTSTANEYLQFRLGYGDGASIITTAASYKFTEGFVSQTNQSFFREKGNQGSAATDGISGSINIISTGSTNSSPLYEMDYTDVKSLTPNAGKVHGYIDTSSAENNAIDTLRMFWSSGNFALVGDVYVYGLKRA